MEQKYTKEAIIMTLKKVGWLKNKEINQHSSLPAVKTITRLFKTTKMSDVWRELKITIPPSQRPPKYTKEEIAKVLKKIGWLKKREISQHPSLPAERTILKLFKTTKLSDIWRELKITPPLNPRQSKYTKEKIGKALKEIGWLKTKNIEQHPDLPAVKTITDLFNTTSMKDVWISLKIKAPSSYTKNEVAKALKEIGWLKTEELIYHPDLPAISTIVKLFKKTTMSEVWEELNIASLRTKIPPKYTKDEIAKVLKKTGYLKGKKINQHQDLPALMTILKLFNTTKITDVWKELNIPVPDVSKSIYTKNQVGRTLKKIGWIENQKINENPDLPSHTTIKKLFNTNSMSAVYKKLNIGIPPRYTKKRLSNKLKEIGFLTQTEIAQHPDLPSVPTILRLFKTTKLADVWKELGLFSKSKPTYTKEEVARKLKETGKLKQKEIEQHPGFPTVKTILCLFEATTISDVWRELKLTPFQTQRQLKYTKNEVAKVLKKVGWLKTKDIKQHPDLPGLNTIFRLFKTTKMSDVWNQLNIPIKPRSQYTKEAVATELKKTGWLKILDIDRHPDLPSTRTIVQLFGKNKMSEVWQELNIPFPLNDEKEAVARKLKNIGKLTQKEIDQHPDLPAHTTVLKLFKATKMRDVWSELNITPLRSQRQSKYTKEALAKKLKQMGYLTQKKIDQHPDLPSAATITRIFKTTKISDIWEELGLK